MPASRCASLRSRRYGSRTTPQVGRSMITGVEGRLTAARFVPPEHDARATGRTARASRRNPPRLRGRRYSKGRPAPKDHACCVSVKRLAILTCSRREATVPRWWSRILDSNPVFNYSAKPQAASSIGVSSQAHWAPATDPPIESIAQDFPISFRLSISSRITAACSNSRFFACSSISRSRSFTSSLRCDGIVTLNPFFSSSIDSC